MLSEISIASFVLNNQLVGRAKDGHVCVWGGEGVHNLIKAEVIKASHPFFTAHTHEHLFASLLSEPLVLVV